MLRLTGPEWVSVYDVAEVFDLSVMAVGRLRTFGLLRGKEVRPQVWRYRLAEVEQIANMPGWYATRARNRLNRTRRPPTSKE